MRKSLFVKRVKVLAVYGRRVDGRREQDKHMQPVSECKNQKKTIYMIQIASMGDKITNTNVPTVESLWPILPEDIG